MKIGQPSDQSVAITQGNQAGAAKAARQEAASAARNEQRKAPTGVDVKVSALAARLDKAAEAPEVDTEKVDAIRKAIADRSYTVNPQAIADKLLANAREVLQRSSS